MIKRNTPIFIYFFFLTTITSFAQKEKKTHKHLIAATYENDVFILEDRYYSFGNLIDYRRVLESDFIFKNTKEDQLQLNFTLGQKGFTPDEFEQSDVSLYDYPYAGWLFLDSEITKSNQKRIFAIGIEAGLTGPASFADVIQELIHEVFNFENQPTWVAQIPTALLADFKSRYSFEFSSKKEHSFLTIISSGAVGLKDVFLEEEALFSFGKRNPINKTTLFNNIPNSKREFYGYIGAGYRYVAYNHFIEGAIFNNNAPFTLGIKNHLFKLRVGTSFQIGSQIIKLEHYYNTAENNLSKSHQYTSISIERFF